MSYFGSIFGEDLIERELTVRGITHTVYWRPLTGGQGLKLRDGISYNFEPAIETGTGAGVTGVRPAAMKIVPFDNRSKQLLCVQMTLCDEKGAIRFASMDAISKEPEYVLDALIDMSEEVHKKDDAGND